MGDTQEVKELVEVQMRLDDETIGYLIQFFAVGMIWGGLFGVDRTANQSGW